MLSLFCFILSLAQFSGVLVKAQDYPEGRYSGVQRFLSRPDIECLGWKVTVYDEENLAPGYWFVSPYEVNGLMVPNGSWVGPHIYDHRGELVWSGSGFFEHINVMDFKVINMGGEDKLSMTYAVKGNAYVLNRDYTVNQTIDIGQTQDRYNMHDFGVSDDGNRFLYLKRNISFASAELTKQDLGYDGTCHVTFPEFEERDIRTGEVTHFWDATGKIPLSDSTMAFAPVDQRCGGGMWDYLHSNAIDKFADGNYIISTRHSDTIYKISKDDGSIMWRLHGHGGEKSDFEMLNDLNFTRQHDVKIHEQNETHTIISFLDNAVGADPQPASTPWSRGIFAAIDEVNMQATLIAQYPHPHQGHAFRRGSMQPLPNGNIFMGWSEQALHTEHTPDGKLLMEAELVERKLGSYRSYKFELVADPADPPDVYSNASTSGEQTTTSVYASWNGATKVAGWTVYKTNTRDTILPVGAATRTGFETKIDIDGYAKYVFVQAIDESGHTLGESAVIETMARDVSSEALSEELVWLRSSNSQGLLAKIAGNPIAIFVGGIFCGIMAILLFRVASKRGLMGWRSRSGQTYERVSVADTSDYDETRLDDLNPRSYRDKSYTSDEDEGA